MWKERRDLRIARPTPALVVAAGIVLLVLAVRLVLFEFQSMDYRAFVAQWYAFIDANGGFAALRYEFANYNMPYLYLLAILTYLPVPVLAGVKVISVLGDLLLAFYAYKLVALRYPNRWVPFLAAAVVSLLPTVVVNSAMWAQCDSIYAAFALGGVYYVVRSRPWLACVLFGVALAFKVQAVFLLPVLLVLVLLRKMPWTALLVVPGTVLLLDGPALLAGADPGYLLSIYTQQVEEYSQLTLNAPNVYQFLSVSGGGVELIRNAGVLFTGALVLVVVLLTVISRVPLTVSRVVLLSTVLVILVPFFLPAMHERYFYLADALSVVAAFYLPRRLWYLPILVQFASFLSYAPFLFGTRAVDLKLLALAMLVALVLVVRELALSLRAHEQAGKVPGPGVGAALGNGSQREARVAVE
jgi:Gpi18-like mannosyltransferase